jgi:hypothetical protein
VAQVASKSLHISDTRYSTSMWKKKDSCALFTNQLTVKLFMKHSECILLKSKRNVHKEHVLKLSLPCKIHLYLIVCRIILVPSLQNYLNEKVFLQKYVPSKIPCFVIFSFTYSNTKNTTTSNMAGKVFLKKRVYLSRIDQCCKFLFQEKLNINY